VRELAKFFVLPLPEKRDLAEAMLWLGGVRLLMFLPFRWLVRLIGRPQPVVICSPIALRKDRGLAVSAVRKAILRGSGRLPWQSSCLVRALAGHMMLRRRHLPSVLQLGVRAGAEREMSAHAWLKCGDIEVVGVENSAEFTPIAIFQA
jgi:hypothetical protein